MGGFPGTWNDPLSLVQVFIHLFQSRRDSLLVVLFIHSFIHSFIRSIILSFVHLFIRSFLRSFVQHVDKLAM